MLLTRTGLICYLERTSRARSLLTRHSFKPSNSWTDPFRKRPTSYVRWTYMAWFFPKPSSHNTTFRVIVELQRPQFGPRAENVNYWQIMLTNIVATLPLLWTHMLSCPLIIWSFPKTFVGSLPPIILVLLRSFNRSIQLFSYWRAPLKGQFSVFQ